MRVHGEVDQTQLDQLAGQREGRVQVLELHEDPEVVASADLGPDAVGRCGDLRGASEAFEAALAIDDRNATPYLAAAFDALGSTYRRIGRDADAAAAAARATELTRSASVRSE